jgi:hypothetical protein
MTDFTAEPLSRESLMEVASRTYYTIDGLWFLAVEEAFGFEKAFELNQSVWKKAGPILAKRLLKHIDTEGKHPLQILMEVLLTDPLANVHHPHVVELTERKAVFRCIDCPIQVARIRDGRGVYNGIPGCTICNAAYARAVDERITTRCVACAPNPDNPEYWCEWVFELPE